MTDSGFYPPSLPGPVPADEYRRLVEHHIECETLGTGLAEAAKTLLALVMLRAEGDPTLAGDKGSAAFRIGIEHLRDAVNAFDAHQWPEADRPNLADAITHLSALREALSAVQHRLGDGRTVTAAAQADRHFQSIRYTLHAIARLIGEP